MRLTKRGIVLIVFIIVIIALAVGNYFWRSQNSNQAEGRRTPIDAEGTYQMQIYVTDDGVPKKKQFVSGASGVLGEYQEKMLYDAIKDLQKSTPSWGIEIDGTGKKAIIKSIKGVTNGEHGKKSKWKIKLNGKKITKSMYETKIKRQDNIEIYFETK